jgi:hypothetical protein
MKKALVVGIDKYTASPLYGCVNDATEFANIIETNEDETHNFEIQLEKDVLTRSKLRKLIVDFFKGDTPVTLFYFSGHGFFNEYGGGYLVTPDIKEHDEGVPMDEILNIANRSKAQNRIIILDCCHSGAMGAPNIMGNAATLIHEGVTILTASRDNEASREFNGHGVFTNLLLEALKGGAADLRGRITPGSIYSYIDKSLGELGQRPVFKTNTTRFISLRETVPQVPEKTLKKIIKYFPKPKEEFLLNPSFEDTNSKKVKHKLIAPLAIEENVAVFKDLQLLQSVGLVVPVNAPFMYFAAMQSKSCKLTPLGYHYWSLVKERRI